jgi:hypothetical protein
VSPVSVSCCQVEVSATGLSLVQRGPTECVVCVSECDREASIIRWPWPTKGCPATKKIKKIKMWLRGDSYVMLVYRI